MVALVKEVGRTLEWKGATLYRFSHCAKNKVEPAKMKVFTLYSFYPDL